MKRYVIIGSGVAGISAVAAIRSLDQAAEINLVGDDPHGFYSRPGLAYCLSGEIPEKQLYLFSQKDWQQLNVRFVKGRATRIDPQAHQVDLGQIGKLTYERLLLATGALAVRLNAPGADLSGIVKLDHFEDARQIMKLGRKARTAVVVGGGITALELVEGLATQGVEVHYFLRGDHYWSNVLDETESAIVEQRLEEEGVHIHYQTEIDQILGRKGRITGVQTRRGQQLRCDLLAAAVGIKPRLELAQAAGLGLERGILVNEYLQTSDPDIFAAGDVAQVYDPLSGRSVLDSLWAPAREQGWHAGANMAGAAIPYSNPVALNITRLAGLTTSIIGAVGASVSSRTDDLVSIARGDSETWQALPNTISTQSGSDVNHLRLLIGEHSLVGALLMGDQTLSYPLQDLVREQVDITSIRESLLLPNASLGNIVMDFWTHWRSSHVSQE